LQPLTHLEWPILAGLSDQQTGVGPARAKVWPQRRHPWCQAHDLRHLAAPLADVAAACKGERRKAGRQHGGDRIRTEPRAEPSQAGVWTVTGLLPSPLEQPKASAAHPPVPECAADAVVTPRCRPTRSRLTLKGRPPCRWAGMATAERLDDVAGVSLTLLRTHDAPRLAPLSQGLQAALAPFAQTSQEVQQGAAGLRAIADI